MTLRVSDISPNECRYYSFAAVISAGLRINNGMVSGEMYRVMQNATYIEASSGGNDTASAALQSDLLLTDGTNGGQSMLHGVTSDRRRMYAELAVPLFPEI